MLLAGEEMLPPFAARGRRWLVWGAGGVVACLPDVDYVSGLWRGHLNTTHQYMTHSLAWIVLVALGLWLVGRAWRPASFGRRALWLLLALLGSHLLIDWVTADHLAPYGFPLWAPFSFQPAGSPFGWLPAWQKTALADVWHGANLWPLAREVLWGLLVLAGCGWAKRGWTRHHPSL